jgi:uncharacterized damage-inducible protein DinB
MNLSEPLIVELQREAATTKRLLERVPVDALDWQPHEKSMTMGRLAAHIATLPRMLSRALDSDEFDTAVLRAQAPPTDDVPAILAAFDENVATALELLKTQADERLMTIWRYMDGEKLLFEMPRLAVIRFVVINHMIHHRGQLSVYLRLKNVALSSVYGPTADEAVF